MALYGSKVPPEITFELRKKSKDVVTIGNHFKTKSDDRRKVIKRLIDFRPDFVKSGLFFDDSIGKVKDQKRDYAVKVQGTTKASESLRQEILDTEPKVYRAFDRLAEQINLNLDYPDILVEFGVEGMASLDLYFDSKGQIDESASRYLGSSRLLRGMLVQASRKGLIQWFNSEAKRLNRDEFKNQHYRADFTISSFLSVKSTLDRQGLGRYQITRRKAVENCVAAAGSNFIGFDASCVTIKAVGWIRERFSDTHRLKFESLKDRMETFDELELKGINDLIRNETT